MKYDLHLHTTASDGRLDPAALVSLAREKGLEIIAVADHDSVGKTGEVLEAASHEAGMTVIPAVEIDTHLGSDDVHILGYFIDPHNAPLALALQDLRKSRVERSMKIVEKLNGLGKAIEWPRVLEFVTGESICRRHIAQALLEKGCIGNEREAFDKYIGRGYPAFVEGRKIHPSEAVQWIKSAGGLPVLAHPAKIEGLDKLIVQLKKAGLAGLEAYYGRYNPDTVAKLVSLAGDHGLLTTGGSDYHHFCDGTDVPMGSVDIPEDSIRRLFERSGHAGWLR